MTTQRVNFDPGEYDLALACLNTTANWLIEQSDAETKRTAYKAARELFDAGAAYAEMKARLEKRGSGARREDRAQMIEFSATEYNVVLRAYDCAANYHRAIAQKYRERLDMRSYRLNLDLAAHIEMNKGKIEYSARLGT